MQRWRALRRNAQLQPANTTVTKWGINVVHCFLPPLTCCYTHSHYFYDRSRLFYCADSIQIKRVETLHLICWTFKFSNLWLGSGTKNGENEEEIMFLLNMPVFDAGKCLNGWVSIQTESPESEVLNFTINVFKKSFNPGNQYSSLSTETDQIEATDVIRRQAGFHTLPTKLFNNYQPYLTIWQYYCLRPTGWRSEEWLSNYVRFTVCKVHEWII